MKQLSKDEYIKNLENQISEMKEIIEEIAEAEIADISSGYDMAGYPQYGNMPILDESIVSRSENIMKKYYPEDTI